MLIERIHQHEQLVRAVSRLFGWVYFLCWSISFYPQLLLNLRRKSTMGMSVDLTTLNVLGFVALTTSNAVFMFSPKVRSQYAARNPVSPEPTVQPNDLAFAGHALLLTIVIYSQLWLPVWGIKVNKFQTGSRLMIGIFWACVLVPVVCVIIAAAGPTHGDDPERWAWIDVIYIIGYVKIVITTIKYIPQVWLNYNRKSTLGFSIVTILLDFAGGILSILQLILDSSLQDDWSGITGNPAKLLLGNVSLFFDIIFFVQHYILWGDVDEQKQNKTRNDGSGRAVSEEPLLGEAGVTQYGSS